MKRFMSFVFLGVLVLGTGVGFGQPMYGMEGLGSRERVMEMIRTLRIVRMREKLALTDEQVASILPKLSQRDSIIVVYLKTQAEDLGLLKAELERNNPRDATITQILDRMKQREKAHHDRLTDMRDEILAELSAVQQAQFVIFELEFERELRNMIQQIRGERNAPPPR